MLRTTSSVTGSPVASERRGDGRQARMTTTLSNGGRGSWTISVHYHHEDYWTGTMLAPGRFSPPPRIILDGLLVTVEQAHALAAQHRRSELSFTSHGWTGLVTAFGIELTEAEAGAIRASGDPLSVLLPRSRFRVRALTLAELAGCG